MVKPGVFFTLLFGLSLLSIAQTNTSEAAKSKVFIDCSFCDQNYIRDEITFVDYVRDRKEADVHIIIIRNHNGSGGMTYECLFFGRNMYEGKDDTLAFEVQSDASNDEVRQLYVQYIKLGLIPYVYKTLAGENIEISFEEEAEAEEEKDKWNNWVFTLSGNSWMNGQKTYSNINIHSDIYVRKVKPNWKTSFYLSSSYNEEEYNMEEYDYYYTAFNRSFYGEHEYVYGISPHWSIGSFLSAHSSTYSNINISSALKPGIEYNIFDYEKATTKQIRIVYKIGPDFNKYNDTTIYDKTEEWLWPQSLSIAAKSVQKWGSISGSINSSAYMHDFSKNSLGFYLNTSIRLIKGLEFNISGNYSMVHNQMNIPKGDVTQEELLLQQRQLETQYNYWASIGISYTFGSIYNNIINPRFGF